MRPDADAGTPPAPAGTMLTRTLGSTTPHHSRGLAQRDAADANGGFAKQVDLTVSLPLGPDGAMREIDVTLTQRSRVRPSASLLDGVYLHQFKPRAAQRPAGPGRQAADGRARAMRTRRSGTTRSPRRPSSPNARRRSSTDSPGMPATVYLGPGIAAVYSFDDDVLGNWRKFDAEMHRCSTEIGAL